jgi:aspartokinase-like uncharacterized kinase
MLEWDRPDRPVTIYKVGGSLFDWREFADRLCALLDAEPVCPVVVAGGGAAADVVREWDSVHQLGETQAHRLAILSLCLSEALLTSLLPRGVLVVNRDQAVAAWSTERVPILCVDAFLAAEEQGEADSLPASWNVTSDSLAAWIAARWPASLVLLKSTTPEAAGADFVDPCFRQFAACVRQVNWINLRSGERGEWK